MHLLWLCNWLLSTLQCFDKWALVMQYRIYSKPTKLNAPLKVITAFLSPPSCLFSEAQHVSRFARPNYKCMLPSRDMTAAIRLQKLWHDCHNSSVLWPRKKKNPAHLFPGWSCQSLSLTNEKGPGIKPREALVRAGLRSPLLEFTGEWVFKWAQFAAYLRNTSESN